MNNKLLLKNISIYLILLLSGALSVILFLIIKPTSIPTDMLFHVSRLQGLDNFFTSPVNFTNFNGSGKIVNITYPPITLLPIIITKIFSSDLYIRYLVTWIYVGLIQSFVSYYCIYKMTNNKLISLLFSIFTTFSVSKFNYMFEHAAISNVLALAFVPIVIWGFKELIFNNYKKFYILAIGLSLITLTHILTTLIIIIFLIIAYLVSLFFVKINKNKFKYQILFAIIFILMSLLVIVPMIEQFLVNKLISANIIWNIHGSSILHYIESSLKNENFLGIFNLFSLIICVIFFKRFSKFEKTLLYSTLLLGLLVLDITPWQILKHTFLVQLQYPTPRITSIINIIVNYLFVKLLVCEFLSKNKIINFSLITVLIVVYILFSWQLGLKSYERAKISAQKNHRNIEIMFTKPDLSLSINKNKNYYINGDYTNVGYKSQKSNLKNFYTINDKIIKNNLQISDNEVNLLVKFQDATSNNLITPISLYKNIKVYVNNKLVSVKLSKYKTVQVPIIKNKTNKIKITYKWTLLARISQIISLITWIVIFIYIYWKNKFLFFNK